MLTRIHYPFRMMIVLLLVMVLLFFVSWTQPVYAVAASLTIGEAIVGLVVLFLSACGITIYGNNTMSAVDFLMSYLMSYIQNLGYNSLLTWLSSVTGITISLFNLFKIATGKMVVEKDVANAILDFCEYFVEDQHIESNGSSIGDPVINNWYSGQLNFSSGWNKPVYYAAVNSSWNGQWEVDDSGKVLTFSYTPNQSVSYIIPGFYIPCSAFPNGLSAVVKLSTGWDSSTVGYYASVNGNLTSGSYFSASSSGNLYFRSLEVEKNIQYSSLYNYYFIGVTGYGNGNRISFTVTLSDPVSSGGTTTFVPGNNVHIPDRLGFGQKFELPIDTITSNMTNEEALIGALNVATTIGGLTTPGHITGTAIPEEFEWVYDTAKDFGSKIKEGAGSLFVPREGFWDDYLEEIKDIFDDNMGILTYPISVLFDLLHRILELEDQEPVLRWDPVVWKGVTVIPGGSYNLNDAIPEESPQETLYQIYRLVISGALILGFLSLCYKKLQEVERS